MTSGPALQEFVNYLGYHIFLRPKPNVHVFKTILNKKPIATDSLWFIQTADSTGEGGRWLMVIRGRLSRKSSKPTVISISKVFYCFFCIVTTQHVHEKSPFSSGFLLCCVHSWYTAEVHHTAPTEPGHWRRGGGGGLWYPPLTHTHTQEPPNSMRGHHHQPNGGPFVLL